MDPRTQHWYDRNASELAGRYDAAEPRELHDFLALVCRPGDRVLDVGCGSGREVAWLRKRGVLACGVDASGAMIAEAGRRHPEIAEFLSQDALPALPGQTGEPYDVVLATAVLMHLPPHEIFEAAFRLKQMLKPQGSLVVSVPAEPRGAGEEHRDENGRLFHPYGAAELELLFGRLGFVQTSWQRQGDGCGRKGVQWLTIHFWHDDRAQASVQQVETVIRRDRKVATYKLALLRALCDLAQTAPKAAAFLPGDRVGVPLGLVVTRWLRYYWPLVGDDAFIPQMRGEKRGAGGISFRGELARLIAGYRGCGGIEAFCDDLRRGVPDDQAAAYRAAVKKTAVAIVDGPVTHTLATSGEGRIFTFEGSRTPRAGIAGTEQSLADALGRIVVPASLWKELSLLGHWIEESSILRWAELTHEISEKRIEVSRVLDLLLRRPGVDRDTAVARDVYAALPVLRCAWTDRPLTRAKFDVDHVIPFSAWKNNDLWNLIPADPRVNLNKLDRIVTSDLLLRRRDPIIACWETLRAASAERFDAEARFALWPRDAGTADWRLRTWAGLVEAVETTAMRRNLERWEGLS